MKFQSIIKMFILTLMPELALAEPAQAVIDFQCNEVKGTIDIKYSLESGKNSTSFSTFNEENIIYPSDLYELGEDENGSDIVKNIKTEYRYCNINGIKYEIKFVGSPGNMNIGGRCGAQESAVVEISCGEKYLVNKRFEGDCMEESPVISRIFIENGNDPVTTEISKDVFYKQLYQKNAP